MRTKRLKKSINLVLLAVSVAILCILFPTLTTPEFILGDDFSHFWASGKLFIHQENPYQLENILSTLRGAGIVPSSPAGLGFQTLNPPWMLIILAPFGFMNYSLARLVWLMVNITLVIIITRQFWNIVQPSRQKYWLALLAVFCFSPTFSVLSKGQVTLWVVLGVAALILYTKGALSSWWAGAGLVLITLKPQLFFLLWPVLGLWVIFQRRWKLLASGAIVWLTILLLLHLVNPQLWHQYLAATRAYPYDQWATPTIGSYLRYYWLGLNKFWIQYLPATLSLIWAIVHFLKHRVEWVWHEQLPALLLISLLTSPYAWTYDQVILLPVMIVSAAWLSRSASPFILASWSVYLGINLTNLLLHARLDDFWFLWLAPAYTIWYLAVRQWHQRYMRYKSNAN